MKLYSAPLAQRLEQIPLKDKVEGSNPSGGTIFIYKNFKYILFVLIIDSRVSIIPNKDVTIE